MHRIVAIANLNQTKYSCHFKRTSNTSRYSFLTFKENKDHDYVQNDSEFYINAIQNIQVRLNQTRFKIDPIHIDMDKNYLSEGYQSYKNVRKDFFGVNPQVSPSQ